MQRAALCHACRGQDTAAEHAVFRDRLRGILRAGREEAAGARKQRRDQQFVAAEQEQDGATEQAVGGEKPVQERPGGIARERDRRTLDGLLLAPVDRSALYLAKVLTSIASMLVVEVVALPVFVGLFNLAVDLPLLVLALVLVYSGNSRLSGAIHESVWNAYGASNDRVVSALRTLRSVAEAIRGLVEWSSLAPGDAARHVHESGLDPAHPRWQGISAFVTPSVLWSLYAFVRSPDDYWETICTAIAVGGDTDTMAAIAGAISGARLGVAALPAELLGYLTDQGDWGADALAELAGACAAIVKAGKARH